VPLFRMVQYTMFKVLLQSESAANLSMEIRKPFYEKQGPASDDTACCLVMQLFADKKKKCCKKFKKGKRCGSCPKG
jgi:hypothetical protein